MGDATGDTVRGAMVTSPYTSPAHATVAEARSVLRDDHVHMVLLVDDDRLVGTLVRDDLADAADHETALEHSVVRGRTVGPEAALAEARARLDATRARRLAVVDEDGTLLGLLCLKRNRTGFCSDPDVCERQARD